MILTYFIAVSLYFLLYVFHWPFWGRCVVHRALRPGAPITQSCTGLVGGAPLLPGITVGVVCLYTVSFGDYSRLYDDDLLYPVAIGQRVPNFVESAVCVDLPMIFLPRSTTMHRRPLLPMLIC